MLRLPCKITFGTFDRFCAVEFISERSGSEGEVTIFVCDNHVIDENSGLPSIIFQAYAESIPDITFLINLIKEKYPVNFITTTTATLYEMRREGMKYHST